MNGNIKNIKLWVKYSKIFRTKNVFMSCFQVATKGNGDVASPSYVSKFVLYYSRDGYDWSMAYAALQSHVCYFETRSFYFSVLSACLRFTINCLSSSENFTHYVLQEFEANNDSTSVKMNTLKISVKAKILRIVPKLWKTKIALKVQLFGCPVHQVPGKIDMVINIFWREI